MSKVAVYSRHTETRANGTTVFYRTGKGSMRHASAFCANSKRSIFTGDVFPIDQAEAKDWQACTDCCSDADVLEAQAAAEAKQAQMCPNSGITHAGHGRIYDTCRDCGKEGKVNRQTGRIRAHKPLTAPAAHGIA